MREETHLVRIETKDQRKFYSSHEIANTSILHETSMALKYTGLKSDRNKNLLHEAILMCEA